MNPMLIPIASAAISFFMKALPVDTFAALVNYKLSRWARSQMADGNVVKVAKVLKHVAETDRARMNAITGTLSNQDFSDRFLEATSQRKPTPKDQEP